MAHNGDFTSKNDAVSGQVWAFTALRRAFAREPISGSDVKGGLDKEPRQRPVQFSVLGANTPEMFSLLYQFGCNFGKQIRTRGM